MLILSWKNIYHESYNVFTIRFMLSSVSFWLGLLLCNCSLYGRLLGLLCGLLFCGFFYEGLTPKLVMVLVWLIWGAVIKWRENHRGESTVMRSG